MIPKAPSLDYTLDSEDVSTVEIARREDSVQVCELLPPGCRPCQAVVFLQHSAQAIMRQSYDLVIIPAAHGPGRHEGVDDALLRRLPGRLEKRVQALVRKHLHLDNAFLLRCPRVGARESKEQVSRAVARYAPRARQSQGGAAGQ